MRRWLTFISVIAVVAGLAIAAGCGGSGGGSGSPSSPSSQELTAQQIYEKGLAATSGAESMAFTLDASLAVKGNPTKATDEQTKSMMESPISLKAKGSLANKSQKMDMTLNLAAAGQKFDIGLRLDGEQMWVQFMDQWYVLDKAMLSGLTGNITGGSPAPSASPGELTQQMQDMVKQLGIDPTSWAGEYKLVGTESLEGVEVYHIQQVLDASKMADDFVKVMGSMSSLMDGASASPPSQEEMQEVAKGIKDAFKDLSIDWYFQKDDFYLRQMKVAGLADFSSLEDAAKEGVEGIDYSIAATTSDFNKEVTVTPPENPKPFTDLMQALMGSGGLSF